MKAGEPILEGIQVDIGAEILPNGGINLSGYLGVRPVRDPRCSVTSATESEGTKW